ncbi:MAG: zinc-finger domain-containing protein [Candidatus Eutrophobiaceae bacterium]
MSNSKQTPNTHTRYPVTRAMLPLHCPTPETSLWNSHPRVFLPIEDAKQARCPYCGTIFYLQDDDPPCLAST